MTQSAADKIWEFLLKLMVPVSIIVAAAMIRNEVTDARQWDKIRHNEREIARRPPEWLKEDLEEIKNLLKDFDQRLRALENGQRTK